MTERACKVGEEIKTEDVAVESVEMPKIEEKVPGKAQNTCLKVCLMLKVD